MSLPVLTAVTGPWEAPLVAGLERAGAQVRVVRRCVDLAELLSAAGAGLGRAAVVSADLPRLDRHSVSRLAEQGIAVVAVVDPAETGADLRVRRLGVERVLPADAAPGDLADAVSDAVAQLDREPAAPGRDEEPPDAPDILPMQAPGRLVAVWGPIGAPGRTTVAVTLGCELAARGHTTLLVDADTHGASIAAALGLLDETAGIAAATRAANQGSLDAARLADLAPPVTGELRVLTGLPRPQRWPELRPAGLQVVWEKAREVASWTVVDCGFALQTDDEPGPDGPRRSAASVSALRAADVVVAVGGAEPIGLQRLVRGLQDLAEVLPAGATPRVVLNRVRAKALGPAPERRALDAMSRYAGVPDVLLVPDDRDGCDAAMLAGRSLTEAVPGSPARAALAALAGELVADLPAGTARRARRRWRRGR